MDWKRIQCADVIAWYEGKLVLVQRMGGVEGIALPGGHLEEGESHEECIIREFKEETGLDLRITSTLGVFDAPGRDPRGDKVSTVFIGTATGTPSCEPGKTYPLIVPPHHAKLHRALFVFDHYEILSYYLMSSAQAA